MAKSKPLHKGMRCKLDCGGHRAGYRYARDGGRTPSRYSPSFNEGMDQYLGNLPTRVKPKR